MWDVKFFHVEWASKKAFPGPLTTICIFFPLRFLRYHRVGERKSRFFAIRPPALPVDAAREKTYTSDDGGNSSSF